MTEHFSLVCEAASSIKPYVVRTPLVHSQSFSEHFGFPVYLKLENVQVTGAFKVRGAMNKMLALKKARVGHVIAASSGSHAMGVSLAARTCGIKATIVMPVTSPELKRKKVLSYGAELIVDGRNYDDSYRAAIELAKRTGAELVSSVEDELVMAGHGTMALEILEDLPGVDFVGIPIGGGGVISGLLMALKDHDRGIRVWGVQSTGAPSMKVSLMKGEPTELPEIDTIADAIAVRKPGTKPFHMVRDLADGVTAVDDSDILKAVGRLALWAKVVAEPASASTLAVDWNQTLDCRPKAAVFIVTGGNISKDLLLKGISEAEQ
ncbi:MAG: threonine ammonia-lyase [Ignavibacteriales bacterium]